jgi:hypothetical protein
LVETVLKTIHLGSFEAEAFWRDPDLACLPALPDPASARIVAAMDELLFAGCQPGDILITRFPMQACFADYLDGIGFSFAHHQGRPEEGVFRKEQLSIFELLQNASPEVGELIDGADRLEPYAILPGTEAFCQKYNLPFAGPQLPAVVKVNSKAYSHQLAMELGVKDYGCLVSNSAELAEQGKRALARGNILLKDPFGVSGKGNLLISTESMLERIVTHIASQERKGRKVALLVEPFFQRRLDFSCQMRIEPDGQIVLLSIQKMYNHGLAYQGSSSLRGEQAAFLERCGYFRNMEAVAKRIYRDGYWGHLCIDSMVLEDGSLVPVVEINARQSLGLLNHQLDQYANAYGLQSNLAFFSVGCPQPLEFAGLLEKLDQAGMLFTCKQPAGILPLSSNTLTINLPQPGELQPPSRIPKGRFYFSILDHAEERQGWIEKLTSLLEAMGLFVYTK